MGIEARLPDGILLTTVEKVINWGRAGSLFPVTFGLACCAIEMMSTGAAHYDLARFGMEVFRGSPRQADLMIIAGRVSQKMAPVIRNLYDQMPDPKWVISMGVCASSGGMFNNYAIVQGVDHILPVDMYVPGCPPRPEMLMDGIVKLHAKIKQEQFRERPRKGESMEDFRRRTGWPTADDAELDGWAAHQPTRKSGDSPVATGTGHGQRAGQRVGGEQL
jgi:NADH-quinone oxidoreductase subunit B